MKRRFIGVLHLTGDGDGVIEILGEEKSSLQALERQFKAPSVEKSLS